MHPRARSRTRTRTTSSTGPRARSWRTRPTSARSRSPRSAWASRRLQKWIKAHRLRQASRASTCPVSSPAGPLPDDKWYGTGILNVPIGESIAVTPLQMAALYASVANGGTVDPAARDRGHRRQAGHRAGASASWCRRTSPRELRGMLTDVVDYGTGTLAQASRATAWPARPARRRSTTPSTGATATPTRAIASTRRRSSASRPPSIRASSRS